MAAFDYAPAIAVFPLVAFALALFGGRYLPKRGAIAGIAATGASLVLSLWMVLTLATGADPHQQTLYTFVAGAEGVASVDLSFGIFIDQLSALMLVIVSLISLLVHVFSLGYMNDEGETGLPRYYAGLGLFTFSMLAFVFSDNLLMSFMFFELVGLCSYLLIGFWFREDAPSSAAKKAFLVTRFGDYFFLIGVVAVFATFGTTAFVGEDSFIAMAEQAMPGSEAAVPGVVSDWLGVVGLSASQWFTVVGLLVLGGVIGKSAQFPLHTWLPDAMEGPTPVSALIHAATMVAAGVYLVARMYGFYALSPTALGIIALIGGFTALFAATMALVKQELKQVLAYSTISQYGYMMLALGGGGYVAAVFHLTTHAAFKALLFLGAGSVIIAMHHNENMWDMGGLKDRMRVTYLTFLAGSLALAGIFPFAGFWSKDEVLYETLIHGLGSTSGTLLLLGYAFGLLAVVFTAFYTFRMVFLTFHGDARTDTAEDPEPVRWNVKVPLAVLGVFATVLGVINLGAIKNFIGESNLFLHEWLFHGAEGLNGEHYEQLLHDFAGYTAADLGPVGPGAVSLALALVGVGLAYRLYGGADPDPHMTNLGSIRTLLMNNYYLDEFQVWLATGVTAPVARAADTFDQGIIDGVVNGVSSVSLFSSDRFRRIQTGVVTNYAALLTLGLTLLVLVFALAGGWF
ncbi:NADH-quinone oxidoreductase subunit L [Salinirussus salinus]|jgi:NADH-quinone oxidoreductase subunit L|uniref:NADH-quinone oxidoreductase subunit L n=1 Tax=Salinirussus salinus TaxID=1198300 RepID=UPI001358FD2E|nr:NADH-quinone oxidoreductase subunit L [Salinirussus salinus]